MENNEEGVAFGVFNSAGNDFTVELPAELYAKAPDGGAVLGSMRDNLGFPVFAVTGLEPLWTGRDAFLRIAIAAARSVRTAHGLAWPGLAFDPRLSNPMVRTRTLQAVLRAPSAVPAGAASAASPNGESPPVGATRVATPYCGFHPVAATEVAMAPFRRAFGQLPDRPEAFRRRLTACLKPHPLSCRSF